MPFDPKRLSSVVVVIILYSCITLIVFAQRPGKKPSTTPGHDPKIAQQQELIARLVGVVNELKGESDKPNAALLQSEVADVLWKFDQPTARSIFRLAFDSIRQDITDTVSSRPGKDSGVPSRRRISALRVILKRYGLRDRKDADAWLQEFENDVKPKQTGSENRSEISPQQAELLADVALNLVSTNPKEAARLGVLSLSSSRVPTSFGRLLMALRDRDKTLSDLLFRQALVSMRSNGFRYDSALSRRSRW